MQAITTKYHGPSNVRGSRIIARAQAGSIVHGYDHALNPEQNHAAAARKLVEKLGWTRAAGYSNLIGGALHTGEYAWVFTDSNSPAISTKA
jgi:hypothetical protein